ncbi:type II toxin-antitoxin system PemK/MazF family toxin [Alcanivorax hongdengensis]
MIKFHPRKGTVLCCDFSKGFEPPEMVKVRPVIVITPQLPGRPGLCTVVPISSVEPVPMQPYHHKMDPGSLTPKMQATECWAKCDMLYTVGLNRLDRIRERKPDGKRIYMTTTATADDMTAIEVAILNGLGLRKYLK